MPAAGRVVVFGVLCGVISTAFLLISLLTDNWFVIDASEYVKECRKEILLQQLYPELLKKPDYRSQSNTVMVVQSGEIVQSTTQAQITLGNQTMSWMEKPHNDWPGSPIISHINRNRLYPSPMRKRRLRRTPLKSEDKHGNKLQTWNKLIDKLRFNLHGFGGRDISFDHRNAMLPSSERNNNCVDTRKKSIEINSSIPCTIVDCSKWQFSTHAGLWRSCLQLDRNGFLSEIADAGKFPRCAPVRYSKVYEQLPAGLRGKHREEAYGEEWTTLQLRRILASFLCMAAPVQIFAIALIIFGWTVRRQFVIYSGGLVLIMSGTFQLLAIGTSGILFNLELNRKPPEIYGFPDGVSATFGCSAHALWAAAGYAIFSGFLCAIGPSLCSFDKARNRTLENGFATTQLASANNSSFDDDDDHDKVSMVVKVEATSPRPAKTGRFRKQSYSVDTGTEQFKPLLALNRVEEPTTKSTKTSSTPNLWQCHERSTLTRGRSTIGGLRRSSTPVAAVWQLQGSEYFSSHSIYSNRVTPEPQTRASFDSDNTTSQKALTLLRMSSRRSLPNSRSLLMAGSSNEHKLSLRETVDISQRLRHARYARRISHSYDTATCRVRGIIRGVSLDDARRTQSLPRPTIKQSPLHSTTDSSNSRLRDHRGDFFQRNLVSPSGSEIIPNRRGRAAYLISIGKNFSDDPASKRARLLHPQVARLSQDGSTSSRPAQDARGSFNRSFSRESSHSYVLERESTLDSVRECSESEDNLAADESAMKYSLASVSPECVNK